VLGANRVGLIFEERQMETSKARGVLMKDDVVPPVAKEPEKKADVSFALLVIAYALVVTACWLGGALQDAKKRIHNLAHASFGEVALSKPMTLEEAAADPGISARMGPERWYDDYCVIGGRMNDEGDYDYMRLTPEAYATLKVPSEFEREWGSHLSIYGRAGTILRERRKAQTTTAPPSAK